MATLATLWALPVHRLTPPKLLRHRRRGRPDQAYIAAGGQRRYLGIWGEAATLAAYEAAVAAWAASLGLRPEAVRPDVPPEAARLTVADICLAYSRSELETRRLHPSTHAWVVRAVGAFGRELGEVMGSDLRPRHLGAYRRALMQRGTVPHDAPRRRSRSCNTRTATQCVAHVLEMLRWAEEHDLIRDDRGDPVTVTAHLRGSLSPATREPGARRPAPPRVPGIGEIRACRRHLRPAARVLLRVHALTGARAGELVGLRWCDIDRSDAAVWVVRMMGKAAKIRAARGRAVDDSHARVIRFGPRARLVLARWERQRPPAHADDPVFPARGRSPYTVDSYRRALARACDAAGVARVSPLGVRRWRGSVLRALGGVEHAQAVLGHGTIAATQIYAEKSRRLADAIARRRQ